MNIHEGQRPAQRARTGRPHANASTGESKRREPNETRPAIQSVYDGQTCLGYLVPRPTLHGVEAFTVHMIPLGLFPDRLSAARAVFLRGGGHAA